MADRAERLEHGREYEVEEDVSGARQAKFPGADQRDWTENDLHHRFTEKLAGLSDKALDAQERRHDITQYTREDRLEVQEARVGAINAMTFATPEEKAETGLPRHRQRVHPRLREGGTGRGPLAVCRDGQPPSPTGTWPTTTRTCSGTWRSSTWTTSRR